MLSLIHPEHRIARAYDRGPTPCVRTHVLIWCWKFTFPHTKIHATCWDSQQNPNSSFSRCNRVRINSIMNSIETNCESESVLALFLKVLKSTDFLNVPNFHETKGPDSCVSTCFVLVVKYRFYFRCSSFPVLAWVSLQPCVFQQAVW